jgi:2-keto-3-deoxy-L-rhamnonate aldolase RhmA
MSTGRQAGYGSVDRMEYLTGMTQEVLVMLMIEDVEGVENIKEIVSVPGIDVIVVGQGDLSQSMGLLGQPNHPDVLQARDRVIAAASAAGIAVAGHELITVGSDHGTLLTGFVDALKPAKATA